MATDGCGQATGKIGGILTDDQIIIIGHFAGKEVPHGAANQPASRGGISLRWLLRSERLDDVATNPPNKDGGDGAAE